MAENVDGKTVAGFADEWVCFDQSRLASRESAELFERYFSIFPWHELPTDAIGFDAGCGTGRWARHVAPKVATLHCVDASAEVIAVARRNLTGLPNCVFHVASVNDMPFEDQSADFGYSLGVLHHVPDTAAGIRALRLQVETWGAVSAVPLLCLREPPATVRRPVENDGPGPCTDLPIAVCAPLRSEPDHRSICVSSLRESFAPA